MNNPDWWPHSKPYVIDDCMNVMKDIPDKSIDMVLTDPPYGLSFLSPRTDNHIKIANDDFDDWQTSLPTWLSEFKRILKDDGSCVCFMGGGGSKPVTSIFTLEFIKHFKLMNTIIWDKKTIGLGWRYRPSYETVIVGTVSDKFTWNGGSSESNIVRFNNIIPSADDHPTVKPVKLYKHFLRPHTNPGDIVFDPFLGSGTCIRACREMDRIGLGTEMESKYKDTIKKRTMENISNLERWT